MWLKIIVLICILKERVFGLHAHSRLMFLLLYLTSVNNQYLFPQVKQENSMNPVNCFRRQHQKFAVAVPYLCDTTFRIPFSQLIRCKFCKSWNIPYANHTNSLQCKICRCFNQIPSNFVHAQVPESLINFVGYQEASNHQPLRILLVYNVDDGQEMANGLLCLCDILPKLGKNIQIGCLLYDDNVRVVDLSEGGEMIRINISSLDVVEEKFQKVSPQVLNKLITVLTQSKSKKSIVNGSKIISQLVPILKKKTTILWVGTFNEDSHYVAHQRKPFVETYVFLKIPSSANTLSFSKSLTEMGSNCAKVKLILNNNGEKMTEELHYELYDIFDNYSVRDYSVESSRQKKYPPQILTTSKQILIGCLRNGIILKLGKSAQDNESMQIRVNYTNYILQSDPQQEEQQEGSNIESRETLVINFNFSDDWHQSSQKHNKFLSLFKAISANPARKQILDSPATNQHEIDIFHFLRQCSFLQRFQLNQSIENPNCIFVVWPWVGFKNKKVKFVFYFKSYFCKVELGDNLNRMLELCQLHYAKKDRILPIYYHSMVEQIEEQNQYESDSEDSCNNQRYYSFCMDEQPEEDYKKKIKENI